MIIKINESSFNNSLYSKEYKYPLLYLKNNLPQQITFGFRCYKKLNDEKKKIYSFKTYFEMNYQNVLKK